MEENNHDQSWSKVIQLIGVIIVIITAWLYVSGLSYYQGYYSLFGLNSFQFFPTHESLLTKGALQVSSMIYSRIYEMFLVVFAITFFHLMSYLELKNKKAINERIKQQQKLSIITRLISYLFSAISIALKFIANFYFAILFSLIFCVSITLLIFQNSYYLGKTDAAKLYGSNLIILHKAKKLPIEEVDHYIVLGKKDEHDKAIKGINILCSLSHCAFQTLSNISIIPSKQISAINNITKAYNASLQSANFLKKQKNTEINQFILEILEPHKSKIGENFLHSSLYFDTLFNSGDTDAALNYLNEMLEKSPNNIIVLNNLAYLLIDKDINKANITINKALDEMHKKDLKVAAVYDTQAQVLFKLGDVKKAIKAIQLAYSLAPDDEAIKLNYEKYTKAKIK